MNVMSFEGLTTRQLLDLGGLKERCAESVRCAAHGLALPCDLCDLEEVGHLGAVCQTCGHRFDSVPPGSSIRQCMSAQAFETAGTVAFAQAALDNLKQKEEGHRAAEDAERSRLDQQRVLAQQRATAARLAEQARTRELAEQRRRERERHAAETRAAEERVAAEARALAERAEAEAERDAAERAAAWASAERRRQAEVAAMLAAEEKAAEHLGRRRRTVRRRLVGAAVVGVVAWNLEALQQSPLGVWLTEGKMESTVAPSVSKPVASSGDTASSQRALPKDTQTLVALPAMSGFLTDESKVLPPDDAAYLRSRLERMATDGPVVRLLVVDSTGQESLEQFGARVGNAWNQASPALRSEAIITIAARERKAQISLTEAMQQRLTKPEAEAIFAEQFQSRVRSSGLPGAVRGLVDQLDRAIWSKHFATLGDEGLRAATLQAMDLMASAAARWAGKTERMAPAELGFLDMAAARLESMPKPPRGDRRAARQLHTQGISLIGQAGFESLAVEKMQLAHAADPLDVQIVNDLAYAELLAGNHAGALALLQQTLRLAPGRTSAWVNLAETVLRASPGNEAAERIAVTCYWLGFHYSGDRAKTIEYLRSKVAAVDTPPSIRAAATQALQPLELLNSATSVGTSGDAPLVQ
jgi:hypothetical protein